MSHAGEGRRVVLVDDDEDSRGAAAMFLGFHGVEVEEHARAEEALASIAQRLPDALVIDLGLPGIDGEEAARMLRATPATRPLFIIAMTGRSRDDVERSLFDEVLTKPVSPDDLASLIVGRTRLP